MCFGETSADSLRPEEQSLLQVYASDQLPDYRPAIRSNDDIVWVVLEPVRVDAMPRFTICRIAPCIVVMVEDATKQRRFASMPSVEDAIAFACRAVCDAVLALRNIPGTRPMTSFVKKRVGGNE